MDDTNELIDTLGNIEESDDSGATEYPTTVTTPSGETVELGEDGKSEFIIKK